MHGHIDQIDSVVHFETRQMLDTWDKQIQSLCFQVVERVVWWERIYGFVCRSTRSLTRLQLRSLSGSIRQWRHRWCLRC